MGSLYWLSDRDITANLARAVSESHQMGNQVEGNWCMRGEETEQADRSVFREKLWRRESRWWMHEGMALFIPSYEVTSYGGEIERSLDGSWVSSV